METEQIAILILEASKAEMEREPDATKCHPSSLVFGALKPLHKLEDADLDRGLKYLIERGLIRGHIRPDGSKGVFPSSAGVEALALYNQALEAFHHAREDRRWTRYGVIVAILAVLVTLALQFL